MVKSLKWEDKISLQTMDVCFGDIVVFRINYKDAATLKSNIAALDTIWDKSGLREKGVHFIVVDSNVGMEKISHAGFNRLNKLEKQMKKVIECIKKWDGTGFSARADFMEGLNCEALKLDKEEQKSKFRVIVLGEG